MGYFSWKTCDTQESIKIDSSKPVYLLLPYGKNIKFHSYDGYGRFDGMDIHAFLAYKNGFCRLAEIWENEDEMREHGIDLECSEDYEKAKFKLKFSFNKNAKYQMHYSSKACPNQGL